MNQEKVKVTEVLRVKRVVNMWQRCNYANTVNKISRTEIKLVDPVDTQMKITDENREVFTIKK